MERENLIKKELQKAFPPEFINRLDDTIYFKSLEKEDVLKILDVELSKTIPRIESLGYKIKIADSLKTKMVEDGFDEKYGARPIKRMIQKYVEDIISELMMENKIPDGSHITLELDESKPIPVKCKIKQNSQKK